MKTIIIGVALLVLNSIHSQVTPLEDHIWKLESVVTADSTLVVPSDIYFTGNFYSTYYVFGGCSTLGAETLYDDTNMSFNALFPSTNLQVCPNQQELVDIEDFFIEDFFYLETSQMTTYEPFSYQFSTTADKIYLDITNNVGSIATFYDNLLNQEEFLENQMAIYPNPVKDMLHVDVSNVDSLKFTIYDLNGRAIIILDALEKGKLDLTDLSTGVYILKIETNKGVFTKKLIKD